jgi:NifU-like protein involved in Fe-S cluster formation
MIYSELTRRHFESADQAGVLTGPGTRRGAAGDRAQGTWVQFDLQFGHAGDPAILSDAKFLAFGCPHVIAVCDWLAQHAVAMRFNAVRPAGSSMLPETVAALQRRFDVPIDKMGRLLVVEDAWIAAAAPP